MLSCDCQTSQVITGKLLILLQRESLFGSFFLSVCKSLSHQNPQSKSTSGAATQSQTNREHDNSISATNFHQLFGHQWFTNYKTTNNSIRINYIQNGYTSFFSRVKKQNLKPIPFFPHKNNKREKKTIMLSFSQLLLTPIKNYFLFSFATCPQK